MHVSISTCIVTHTAELATTWEHPEGTGKLDMVKKIQGAAAKETLQGAGRASSSWESLQSKAERGKT